MLVIRKEQYERLNSSAAEGFEASLVRHIQEFSPRHMEAIGDEAVREAVKYGVESAKKYGFTLRGPVRFYVELMVMFGSEFATDPFLPWADGVLTNEAIKDQMERADILHEAMSEYLAETAGTDKGKLMTALKKLSKARLEDHQGASDSFESAMLAMIRTAHPEKAAYVGEDKLKDLILRGRGEAAERGIATPKGIALLVVLMFELGHGILNDRFFPWISGTLENEDVTEPDERIKQLREKVQRYLEKTLENLGAK